MNLGSKQFIAIVFVVLVSSIIAASGSDTKVGREYAKVNGFNVSFQLNETHDFKVNQSDGINGSVAIRTFNGSMIVNIFRYPTPRSINSTWVNDYIASFSVNNTVQAIEVDKGQGICVIGNDKGSPWFVVLYDPDLTNGKVNVVAVIISNLPLYETADLLRTIHVAF